MMTSLGKLGTAKRLKRGTSCLGKRISVSSHLFDLFHVELGELLGLLSCSQGVDLFARSDEAAVVLLLELGANVIEGHERVGAFEIFFILEGSIHCQSCSLMRRKQSNAFFISLHSSLKVAHLTLDG